MITTAITTLAIIRDIRDRAPAALFKPKFPLSVGR